MTTAPAHPTLYGPDGQALTTTPRTTGDWAPVQTNGSTTVWERPRTAEAANVVKLERLDTTAAAEQEADALLEDARRAVADARAEAARIRAGATTEANQIRDEARSLRTRTLAAAASEASEIREQAEAETARKEEKGKQLDQWMARAVIFGAVGLTATGEYSLARMAHFPREVAWLLPFVIDLYVIQAFRRHRDILAAICLTIAVNVAYHLADAGLFGVEVVAGGGHTPKWWMIAAVASIASIILWRMHVITAEPRPRPSRRQRWLWGRGGTANQSPADDSPSTATEPPLTTPVTVPAAPEYGSANAPSVAVESPAPVAVSSPIGDSAEGGSDGSTDGSTEPPRTSVPTATGRRHDQQRRRRVTANGTATKRPSDDSETTRQVAALVALMRRRGSADAVTLADAKKTCRGVSERTAARRLESARAEYSKTVK